MAFDIKPDAPKDRLWTIDPAGTIQLATNTPIRQTPEKQVAQVINSRPNNGGPNPTEAEITEEIKSAMISISYRTSRENVEKAIVVHDYKLTQEQMRMTLSSKSGIGSNIAKTAIDNGYEPKIDEVNKWIDLNNSHADKVIAYAATKGAFIPDTTQTLVMLERGYKKSGVANENSDQQACHEVVLAGVKAGVVLDSEARSKLIATAAPSSYKALNASIDNTGQLVQDQIDIIQKQIDDGVLKYRMYNLKCTVAKHGSALLANGGDYPKIEDELVISAIENKDPNAMAELEDYIANKGAKLNPEQLDYIAEHVDKTKPEYDRNAMEIVDLTFKHGIGFVPSQTQGDKWLATNTHTAKRCFSEACAQSPYMPSPVQLEKVMDGNTGVSIGKVAHKAVIEGGMKLSDQQITRLAGNTSDGTSVATMFHIVEEGPLPQTAVDTLKSQIHSIEAREILFRNPAPITPTANATTKQVQM